MFGAAAFKFSIEKTAEFCHLDKKIFLKCAENLVVESIPFAFFLVRRYEKDVRFAEEFPLL